MPINRKYNIGMLLDALREELALKENFKVLFEYVLLAGINDRSDGLLIKISLGFLSVYNCGFFLVTQSSLTAYF